MNAYTKEISKHRKNKLNGILIYLYVQNFKCIFVLGILKFLYGNKTVPEVVNIFYFIYSVYLATHASHHKNKDK